MKSFTDISQSKTLSKILPLESADMYWRNGVSDKYIQCFTPFVIDDDRNNVDFDYDIPCWSLSALLGVLPAGTRLLKSANISSVADIKYHCNCPMGTIDKWYDNPVDACYEMVMRLNELKML